MSDFAIKVHLPPIEIKLKHDDIADLDDNAIDERIESLLHDIIIDEMKCSRWPTFAAHRQQFVRWVRDYLNQRKAERDE